MASIAEKIYVGQAVNNISSTPQFDGYSKVVINIDDDTSVEAGNDNGRTLELTCPWATQEMADNILSGVLGFRYQPFVAEDAQANPAFELGDGITVGGLYSGIYNYKTNYGRLFKSEISAPQDEEVDHEFPFETYGDRQVVRKFLETKAQFAVQSNEIAARVTREGGDNASFGWTLTEDGFVLSSNNHEVFRADDTGITVTGEIRATSGYIGSESQGFKITDQAIWNGVTGLDDNAHYGVYLGTDGIALGKGAFKVDSQGNLYAQNGTFAGTVYAGNIAYGGDAGYFDGYGLETGTVTGGSYGAIGGNTVTMANTFSDINTSLGYANFSNDVFNFRDMATSVWASSIRIGSRGTQYYPKTLSFYDYYGNLRTIYYLGTD